MSRVPSIFRSLSLARPFGKTTSALLKTPPARYASGRSSWRRSLPFAPMLTQLPRGLFDDHFLLGDSFFGDFFNFPRLGDFVQSSPGPVGFCRVLDDGLELELEVPRFRKEDIQVDVEEKRGRLVISGKRQLPGSSQQQGTVHVAGTSVPSFSRVYTIDPRVYDLKKISTDVADGVLTIRIPYVETKVALESSKGEKASEKAIEDVPIERLAPSSSSEATTPQVEGSSQQQSTTEGTSQQATASVGASSSSSSSDLVEKKSSTPAEKDQQQMVDVFRWPPKFEVSSQEPLTFTLTMPPGVTDPQVSLHLLHPGYLQVDVNHTSKSQNDFGYNEQQMSFSRTVPLPKGTTRDQVSAKMQNDKLVICVKDLKENKSESKSA